MKGLERKREEKRGRRQEGGEEQGRLGDLGVNVQHTFQYAVPWISKLATSQRVLLEGKF